MKKLLVTGGTGLVGKNLLNHCKSSEYEILSPRHADLDLLNFNDTFDYLQKNQPDFIVHAAARVGGIKSNMNNLFGYLYDNAIIGFNLINAAKAAGIKNIINLGSSCMYPKYAKNPLSESDLLTGSLEETNEGYAIAKLAVAKLCLYACMQEKLSYKTLIPCNLYGIGDKFSIEHAHMLPAAIRKIHFAKKNKSDNVEIWGTGLAKREFMFAEDLADFIYFALSNFDKIPNIMNVGTGVDYTILQYHEVVKEVLNANVNFVLNTTMPDGMMQKVLDVTIQKSLGWSPKTELKSGIEKTYRYFLETKNEQY